MNNYEFMQEAVDEICKSMQEQPQRWLETTHTLDDTETKVRYWFGLGKSITETWNGNSLDRVFSYEQGMQIYKAFSKMKEKKASKAQQNVLNSLVKKMDYVIVPNMIEEPKPWWKFWN